MPKDKKDKKRKHDEVDNADPSTALTTATSSSKKEKKEKKRKSTGTEAVDVDGDGEVVVKKDSDEEKKVVVVKSEVPLAAFVPFANPLCDERSLRKVLKGVKKAAKAKSLTRGVKETVKAIRKSPPSNPTTTSLNTSTPPHGIVILAADISPMDVISHIPVLCEDHDIPYVYVPSRAELGAASSTKRPTSVVMVTARGPKGKGKREGVKGEGMEDVKEEGDGEAEAKKEWEEVFGELHKVAVKLGQFVKV